MNGSPIWEAIRERDSGGQLGLALQDLQAGLGAELEQLEVAAATTAAGRPVAAARVLDLATLEVEQTLRLHDFEHPVTAYLNSLAPASRRPQLKIRGLLEEHYQPATANRMLAALRGVLRECWHAHLMTIEEYQAATNIPPVRGEPEPRARHLSAGELRALFRACSYVATGEVALSRALASEAGRLRGTWRSAV